VVKNIVGCVVTEVSHVVITDYRENPKYIGLLEGVDRGVLHGNCRGIPHMVITEVRLCSKLRCRT
jgi:hypothetical protein